MPRGVYVRKPSIARDEATARNFAKGHTPEVRAKALESIKENAADPAWQQWVSDKTKEAMHRPDVREKHLAALKNNPVNFKGGNGQELTEVVKMALTILEPLGFVREYPVKTKGHNTQHKTPTSYKTDFGHVDKKIAIELDGTSHTFSSKQDDKKKTEVLEALGWKVIRIKHKKEVNQSHLSAEIMQQLEAFF